MHVDQQPYRDLFTALGHHDAPEDSYWTDLVFPWLASHPEEVRWLADFSRRRGTPIPPASVEDLWRLYALSRVNDALLARCPLSDGADGRRHEHWLTEYLAFADALGFRVVSPPEFFPFFHEIVRVHQSRDTDEPIGLVRTDWPCLTLGDLMFSRAGVTVRGGTRHIVKGAAEESPLYWAYARVDRQTTDLSVGWGSNSQWRTCLRRDYRIDGVLFYNVDAEGPDAVDLAAPVETWPEDHRPGSGVNPELSVQQRRELLVHRCFVTAPAPTEDCWPYDDFLREPSPW